MHALLGFIAMVISLYIWVIIIGAILSWLIAFDVVNRRNRGVYTITDSLYRLTEPALRPIRRALPDLGGLDISPVILILGLIFIKDVVILRLALEIVLIRFFPSIESSRGLALNIPATRRRGWRCPSCPLDPEKQRRAHRRR